LTSALRFAAAVVPGADMPIRQFVNGAVFDPEAIRRMSLALDDVCAEMGLRTRDDPATRLVASKIIKFARRGIRDRAKLRALTLKEFKLD
jgi:hypothetical protein